jgi:hypothetical protein
MTPEERSFRDRFESGFVAVRPRRGDCPNAETLSAYAAGTLDAATVAIVEGHVATCGLCDSLVERVRAFDVPRVVATEAWWKRLGIWFWRPLPAYVIAAGALCVPLLLLRDKTPRGVTVAVPSVVTLPPYEAVAVVEAGATREATTRPGAVISGDSFLLKFSYPINPSFEYAASIDAGPVVPIRSLDETGHFELFCRRAAFKTGPHTVTIIETDRRTRAKQTRTLLFEL